MWNLNVSHLNKSLSNVFNGVCGLIPCDIIYLVSRFRGFVVAKAENSAFDYYNTDK